jgi:hypothetical protein
MKKLKEEIENQDKEIERNLQKLIFFKKEIEEKPEKIKEIIIRMAELN